jgi:hypothetical protein
LATAAGFHVRDAVRECKLRVVSLCVSLMQVGVVIARGWGSR